MLGLEDRSKTPRALMTWRGCGVSYTRVFPLVAWYGLAPQSLNVGSGISVCSSSGPLEVVGGVTAVSRVRSIGACWPRFKRFVFLFRFDGIREVFVVSVIRG